MSTSFDETVKYYRELLRESDRAVVIASVAKLDQMLLECLICLAQQNGDINLDIKDMSLSRKIDTALNRRLIDFELHVVLQSIRKIRNLFAHDFRIRDLNDEAIEPFSAKVMQPYLSYPDNILQSIEPFIIFKKLTGFSLIYRAIVSFIMLNISDWLKESECKSVTCISAVPAKWDKSKQFEVKIRQNEPHMREFYRIIAELDTDTMLEFYRSLLSE